MNCSQLLKLHCCWLLRQDAEVAAKLLGLNCIDKCLDYIKVQKACLLMLNG